MGQKQTFMRKRGLGCRPEIELDEGATFNAHHQWVRNVVADVHFAS